MTFRLKIATEILISTEQISQEMEDELNELNAIDRDFFDLAEQAVDDAKALRESCERLREQLYQKRDAENPPSEIERAARRQPKMRKVILCKNTTKRRPKFERREADRELGEQLRNCFPDYIRHGRKYIIRRRPLTRESLNDLRADKILLESRRLLQKSYRLVRYAKRADWKLRMLP